MAAAFPILNCFLDDDGSRIIVYEQTPDGVRERRIRASYTTYHRAEDLDPSMMRGLKGSDHVAHVALEGDGVWVRVGWKNDALRRSARFKFRDMSVETYEGDVDPVMYWLVSQEAKIAKPRRVYLDFETDSRVPLSRKQDMRVLSWSLTDHESGKSTVGILSGDTEDAETELLAELVKQLGNYDQICTWEGDWKGGEFDTVIFEARTRRCGLGVDARRWMWLNQLAVWRKMNMHSAESGAEKESFKLEDIAFEQIGEGKETAPPWVVERFGERAKKSLGAMAWELWEAGGKFRALLGRYNQRDSELLHRLERKKGYITLFQSVAELCGIPPVTQSLQPTRQMDGFLLRLGRGRNHRFDTKAFRENDEEEEQGKFRGAVVFHPKSVPDETEGWMAEHAAAWRKEHGFKNGILRDVHVCDFKSLYPSVMRSYNLSADAVVKIVSAREIESKGIPEGHCWSPGTGLLTRQEPEGYIPVALRTLMELREQYASAAAKLPPGTPEWVDMMSKSTACKVTANSFYGGGGSKYSRYNHRDVSEACTQNGVYFLKLTAAEGEKRKMTLAYGDSVTGDRTVVTRDPHGWVRIIPIERLWGIASVGCVREGDGKQYAKLVGWKALTENGWKPIRTVMRHRVAKPVHMITTKHGQTRVTEDHALICKGKKTKPGDFVSAGNRFDVVAAPLEKPAARIDLFDHVKDFELQWEYKGRTVTRRFITDGDCLLLDGWGNFEKVRIRRFYLRGSEELHALIRLVGAYVSDGSASLRGMTTVRNMLSFCKADRALQDQVATDLRRIFTGGEVYGPFWTETVYVVRSGTTAMACLFAAMCGFKSRGKRLPAFVFDLDNDAFAHLYRSFETGDGSVDASGAMKFTSNSQELIAGVSYALSQRQIMHSFAYRESKGAWMLRTRKGGERVTRYSIKHIVEVDYSGVVYDLTVDGAHTFVDGVGRVLLHNTDSCYVIGPTMTGFDTFVSWINTKKIPEETKKHGCKENFIELAFEKSYSRVVFVRAKAYCASPLHYKWSTTCNHCVTKSGNPGSVNARTLTCRDCGRVYGELPRFLGEPEIKGIAYKRGDKGRLARNLQGRIIDMLVGGLKVKGVDGKKAPVNAGLRVGEDVNGDPTIVGPGKGRAIETPTEDLDAYRAVLTAARNHVLSEELPLEEVRLSRGINKKLKEYVKKTSTGKESVPAHVTVARALEARGEVIGVGSRIEYVVVDGSASPQKVIPAADFAGECDRFYLWERVYEPSKQLLIAAFPDENWDEWGDVRPQKPRGKAAKVLEGQLGLALSSTRVDEDEIAAPVYNARPLLVEVPESAGAEALERVKAVLAKHPGARAVELHIVTKSGARAVLVVPHRVSTGPKLKEDVARAISGEEAA